jgi:protein-disulfide isomerase
MANSQTTFYGGLAAILVVGAAVIGYVVVRNQSPPAVDIEPLTAPATLPGELVSEEVGVSRGPADAPVTIEEYADYQCPSCGMAATLTVPQILENYVDTGKARFVFFDFPIPVRPGLSEQGAEAARCAGDQGAFWAMHKVLMGRMREWGSKRDPGGMFREYGDALGLDGKAVEDCVDSGKYRQIVFASQQRARQLGIGQTPTFIINGRQIAGLMGYDQMAAIIDEALAAQ